MSDTDKTEKDGDVHLPLYAPSEQKTLFDPCAYLDAFYKTPHSEGAMSMVLFFLPSMCFRMPKCDTLLDVGCGPTIYIPLAFRKHAANIYVSDYSPNNRNEVHKWLQRDEKAFDWSNVALFLRSLEAGIDDTDIMFDQTRDRIRAILPCNVFESTVIDTKGASTTIPQQFDLVTSVFCIEYACTTLDEYKLAMTNVCKLVTLNGHIMLGGVCGETSYQFNGMRFQCHNLCKEHVMECLSICGFCTEESDCKRFKYVERDGIFVLLSQRLKV